MKSFGFILLSLLFFISPARANPSADQMHETATQIASMLQSHMTVLDRTTMTFHYTAEIDEPKISSKQQIADWAGWIAGQFWNLDAISTDVQSIGFYAAVDPTSSRAYGGVKPLLFAIPIKKGAMILNLLSAPENDEAAFVNLKRLADEIGCLPGSKSYEMFSISGVTQLFRNSDQRFCREIIADAYHQLGVQAILYSFPANEFGYGCRYRDGAFNLIDASAIDVDGSALFWNTGRFASLTLTRLISQNYRYAREDFFNRYAQIVFPQDKFLIPGSLDGLDTFERSAQSWRKQHLLSCGPRWSTEGHESPVYLLNMTLRTGFSDRELQDAEIDWHKAYQSRLPLKTFDAAAFQRIAAVEKLAYLQSNLPKDFSKFDAWKKASDLFDTRELPEDKRDQQIAMTFGESVPNISQAEVGVFLRRETEALYDSTRLQPGLFGDILHRMGYGPVLISLKIRDMLSYFGGMPVLATAFPMDARGDGAAFLALNKAAFLPILRSCTAMLHDWSISMDTIQAGECGVRAKPQSSNHL